jgi:NAD(P)-dependent dehydrogenase (short-subunit alcohol dehydrogenase family)
MEKLSLKGRTAIVTGAGQGLGLAYARGLAEMGANIVVAEISEKTGPDAAKELSGLGVKSIFVKTDATKREQLDQAVVAAISLSGTLDIMVNNAGITLWKEAENVSQADWLKLMDINVNAVFYGCQAAFAPMKKQGKGSIINAGSMSAHIVNIPQAQASYNTSKAAVVHLTKSLAIEWAKFGIRVNSISPGYMSGPMAGPFWQDPAIGGVWKRMSPMGRMGEPEELVGVITLLASDAASFTTGSDYVVDGGFICP